MAGIVLDATVSGPNSNSYLTVAEADALFEGFTQLDVWDDLDPDGRCQLLLEATRLIDQYKPWGPRRESAQRLAFPRETDAATPLPEELRRAVIEYCNYKLEGDLTPLKKLQAEGVKSASILGQSTGFDSDPSGLPAGCRRELDILWNSHWPKAASNRTVCPPGDPHSFFG